MIITHLDYRPAIINSFTSAYLQNITATSHCHSRLYPVESAERLDNRKLFLGKRQTSDQHDCTICSTRSELFYCKTCSTKPAICPVDCFEKYHAQTNI